MAEIDYTITEIKKDKCLESYYKNNKVVMQNVSQMSKIVAYKVEGNYVYVVFSNYACAIFDVNTLTIPLEQLEQLLCNTLAKNNANKTNRSR